MDLQTAQTRIYRWAERSPLLEDKRACDVVFEALRERDQLVEQVRHMLADFGLIEEDDNTPPSPASQRTKQED